MLNKKKILKAVKGFRGRARNCIRIARGRYEKSLLHSYRGRKLKSRQFRSLWIIRINAATRLYQLTYGRFIQGLSTLSIGLNRKILSELAVTEPYSFRSIVEQVKQQTNPPLTNYPSLGHLQSELVVNQKVKVWKTHRNIQNNITQNFLQQYYKNQHAEYTEKQHQTISQPVTQTQPTHQLS